MLVVKSESCCPPVFRRQNSIPVHYVEGTHYEVGYSVESIGTFVIAYASFMYFFYYIFKWRQYI